MVGGVVIKYRPLTLESCWKLVIHVMIEHMVLRVHSFAEKKLPPSLLSLFWCVWMWMDEFDLIEEDVMYRTSVCLFVCLFVCLSVCLFVCLSVCLSVCLFVCLSVCLFVCLFVCTILAHKTSLMWVFLTKFTFDNWIQTFKYWLNVWFMYMEKLCGDMCTDEWMWV